MTDERRDGAALLLFAIVVLAVPLVVGLSIYRRSYVVKTQELRDELMAASDYKANHVSRWLDSVRGDALAMSRSAYMSRAVDGLLEKPGGANAEAMRLRLRAEMLSGALRDVILLDAAGKSMVGAQGAELPPGASEIQLAERAVRDRTVVMDAHGRGPSSAHLDVAVPILALDGTSKPAGVVLERVALEDELRWVMQSDSDPALDIQTLLLYANAPQPLVLSATLGANESVLTAWPPPKWNESESHLALDGDSSMDPGTLVLLTRVPDSDWVLLCSLEPDAAESRAMHDVTMSLGWPAAALLIVVAAAQPVLLPRHRAERRRRQDRERRQRQLDEGLEFLLGATHDAFLALGPDLTVRHANERAHILYGLAVVDMIGLPLQRLVAEEDARSTSERLRALEPGEEAMFDAMHEHADGLAFAVRCRARAVEQDGETGYQVLVRSLCDSRGSQTCGEGYQEKLRGLAFDLARTDERERRRLATNLHDRVGQTLTLLRMQLGALESASGEDAAHIVRGARASAERAIQETRHLTSEISPPVLYDLGLEPALDWLAERFGDRFGLAVTVDHDGSPSPCKDVRVALFRAVQELLMNVVKHSKAGSAVVTVRSDEERISITVRDDGIGFDPDSLAKAQCARGSFGLFSIGERLELMGGSMEISSKPGRDTIVRLDAPLCEGEEPDAD